MSGSTLKQLPNHREVDAKLAQATSQIQLLASHAGHTRPGDEGARVAAESQACAAVSQLLDAMTAALHGFNLLMPDPLPPLRVSRRNLRDHFHALQLKSEALAPVEAAAKPNSGWLWRLERQDAGNRFAPLLNQDDHPARIWRDPLDEGAGVEDGSAVDYLRHAADQIRDLIHHIEARGPEDAARYQDAHDRQPQRLV